MKLENVEIKKFIFFYGLYFVVYIKNNSILKVEPFNNQKIDGITNFDYLSKLDIDFNGKEIYRKLFLFLKEKRLFTYKEVANLLNITARQTGFILKNNPFLIVIPCHRVIKSDGRLGGYVLGKDVKKLLLRYEGLI